MSGVLSTAGRLIDFATSEESLCLRTTAIVGGDVPLPLLKLYLDIRLTTEENQQNPQGNETVLGNVRSVEMASLFRVASMGLLHPVPYSSGPRDMGVFSVSTSASKLAYLGSSPHQLTF